MARTVRGWSKSLLVAAFFLLEGGASAAAAEEIEPAGGSCDEGDGAAAAQDGAADQEKESMAELTKMGLKAAALDGLVEKYGSATATLKRVQRAQQRKAASFEGFSFLWGDKPPARPEMTSAVGYSSLGCAAMRAHETLAALHRIGGGPRLVEDHCAVDMAGMQGFEMLQDMAPNGVYTRSIEYRSKVLDDFIIECTGEAVDDGAGGTTTRRQVVLPACGMDTRAYRLNGLPAEVTFFEIDNADVISWKEQGMRDCVERYPGKDYGTLKHPLHRVGADLREADWPQKLTTAGYDPALPSCWAVEGLIMYIPTAGLHSLMTNVDLLTAPGSRIAGDGMYPGMGQKSMPQALNRTLNKYNSALHGDGVAEPLEWLQDHGWTGPSVIKMPWELDQWGVYNEDYIQAEQATPTQFMFFGSKTV